VTIDEFGAQNEIRRWFGGQLAEKSQRLVARDLGVAPSVVNRNAMRLQRGLPFTKAFAMELEAALK